MAGTIADSGTAVAETTETGTQRTESASDSPRQGTLKATFTCGGTSVAPDQDNVAGKSAKVQAQEKITLEGELYSVDKLIGNGGEAEVYVVSSAKGKFALKLYRRGNGVSKDILKRLERLKGKAAVVDILESGTVNLDGTDRGYVLMPLCKDGSVAGYDLRKDADAILRITTMTARNLSELHKVGLLHKDVKPENILYTDKASGLVVLSDFGIADILGEDGSVNTPQSRTVIYAAPELYANTTRIGDVTYAIMTAASDYYALGMSVLSLWMGDSEFRKKEPELVKLKIQGKLPVPDDMPEPLRTITRGLLVGKPENRWSYDEIRRTLEGENVPVVEDAEVLRIVFDSGKDKIAHTVKELAQFMMEDQALGTAYLYKGKISAWISRVMPEMEVKLNDIVERIYPKNQLAGLYAAALALDPQLPFYNRNGNVCVNVNKLLNGEGNLGSNLSDRNNPVYLYCEARQGKKETEGIYSRTCAALKDSFGYAKSVIVWGIYDRKYFRTLQGKKTGKEEKFTEVDCYNITDVVRFCSEHRVVADEDKQFLCSLGFAEMVRVFSEKDADRLLQVRKGIKDYEMLYRLVIQTINPAADISLITDPKDPNYAMDGESIGLLINVAFCAYRCVFDSERDKMYKDWYSDINPYSGMCPASLADLLLKSFQGDYKDSYLHKFFLSKGDRFAAQDKWVAYCTDYDSADNAGKSGPYNEDIAMMKAAEGLADGAFFYFPASGETVYDLDDLNKIKADEIREALDFYALDAWFAVKLQENPKRDLSKRLTYERFTVKYLKLIGKYDKDDENFKRYNKAMTAVGWHQLPPPVLLLGLLEKIAAVAVWLVPCLAMLLMLVIGAIDYPVLDNVGKSVYWVWGGGIVFPLLLNIFFYNRSYDRNLFTYIFRFIVGTVAVYFLCKWFLGKYIIYVTIAAVVAAILWFAKQMFSRDEGASELRKMWNPDEDQTILEPLHYAYDLAEDEFVSSLFGNEKFYRSKYLKSLLHKLKHLVLAAVTTFLLLFPIAFIPKIGDTEKITENHPKIGNTINKLTEKIHEDVSEVRRDEQE